MGFALSKIPPVLVSPKVVLPLTAAVVALAAVAGTATHHAPAKPRYAAGLPADALTVDAFDCGANWTSAKAGKQNLLIANTGIETTEVYLVDPGSGAIYGEIVGLAPGTTDQMPVVLGDGTYALRCWPADADPVTGPPVHVTGGASGATAGSSDARSDAGVARGPHRAGEAVPGLCRGRLEQAEAAGQKTPGRHHRREPRRRARRLGPAHQQYERLGGAYDAFGDVGDAIDGLPSDLPGGVSDSGFGGFHRLEYGLWHGQSAAQLTGPAGDLVGSVDKLATDFPTHRSTRWPWACGRTRSWRTRCASSCPARAIRAAARRWRRSTRTSTAHSRCWESCARC